MARPVVLDFEHSVLPCSGQSGQLLEMTTITTTPCLKKASEIIFVITTSKFHQI